MIGRVCCGGTSRSWLRGLPRYDLEFRRFPRSYQYACLRIGKCDVTARVNTARAHILPVSYRRPDRAKGPDRRDQRKQTRGRVVTTQADAALACKSTH